MHRVMEESEFRRRIGHQIRVARERRGMSQKHLAEMFEADQSYISNIENGRKNASFKTLHKIASVLEMDVNDLMETPKSTDPLGSIQNELVKLKRYISALEDENKALKQLRGRFDVLKSEEFSEILGLLRKANPRVRSLTRTLLTYGTLSKEEIEEKEREFDFVLKTIKSTMSEA